MSAATVKDGALILDGQRIELDQDGHLKDPGQWQPSVARALAGHHGLELNEDQWWLIEFVRRHHHQYGTPPLMRIVVSAFRQFKADPGLGSREIYRLFADHPVRQACRFGGLPKPDWCI